MILNVDKMEKNTTRILFAVTKSLGEAGQLTTEGTMESEKVNQDFDNPN